MATSLYDQINAATLKELKGNIVDNFFDDSPFLAALRKPKTWKSIAIERMTNMGMDNKTINKILIAMEESGNFPVIEDSKVVTGGPSGGSYIQEPLIYKK